MNLEVLVASASALQPLNFTSENRAVCCRSDVATTDTKSGLVSEQVRTLWGDTLRRTRDACRAGPENMERLRALQLPEIVLAELPTLLPLVTPFWRPTACTAILLEASAAAWAALDTALARSHTSIRRRGGPSSWLQHCRLRIKKYLQEFRCSRWLLELSRHLSCPQSSPPCAKLATFSRKALPETMLEDRKMETDRDLSDALLLWPLTHLERVLKGTNKEAWFSHWQWPWWRRENLLTDMVNPGVRDELSYRAFELVTRSLEKCGGVLEWWPTDGTLVALLRYGDLRGHLSEGKVDVVDRDLDFMVGVGSALEWIAVQAILNDTLQDGAAPDVAQCSLVLNGDTSRHTDAGSFQKDELECWYCTGNIVVESVEQVHLASCTVFSIRRYIIQNHRGVVIAQESCEGAAYGIGCRTVVDASPFQAWRGELPQRLLRPFAQCRGPAGRSVPCPREAALVLTLLNKKEHTHSESCLAIPYFTGERQADDERNWKFLEDGFLSADFTVLKKTAAWLHAEGFASFHGLLEDPEGPCAKLIRGAGDFAEPDITLKGPDDLFELSAEVLHQDMLNFVKYPQRFEFWPMITDSACTWLALAAQCKDTSLGDILALMRPGNWLIHRLLKAFPGATHAALHIAFLAVVTALPDDQDLDATLAAGSQLKEFCEESCIQYAHSTGWPILKLQD